MRSFKSPANLHNTRFERDSARWLRSIGERNPIFLDETACRSTSVGTIVAHPTWLYTVADTRVVSDYPGRLAMYGEVAWTFERRLRLGEAIRAVARTVAERPSQSKFAGDMVWQEGETRYLTPLGEPLATAMTHIGRFAPESAAARQLYSHSPYRYTQDEVYAIEDAYETEDRTRVVERSWEEVNEGDEIGTIVRGPLGSEDMLLFVGTTSPYEGYARFHERWLCDPSEGFVDEYGMPDSWQSGLLDGSVSRRYGIPAPHDCGIDRVSWVASMLANWMGYEGFLRALKVRLVRPNYQMDLSSITGRVVAKSADDGEYSVLVDIEITNQRKEVTAQGSATVLLATKSGYLPTLAGR